MVYESDFYTTRRPYSRPLASSYSITTTTPVVLPLSAVIQLRGYLPRMPYIAHKRLVTVIHSPVHNVYYAGSMIPIRIHSRVRPSVIAAELKRIRDLPRPSTESYTEHYLNSKDHIYFDDEAKEIRARVDSLLRRVHVYIPRACPSDFAEEIVPERMRSGDYVRRLISGKNNTKKDAEAVSWYDVPERGNFGNLACVKYVAGKPQSIRRPYYKVADLRPSDIKNDVKFLSYYQKNRQAAADASPDQPMTERELRKARALETEWTDTIVKREARAIPEEKKNLTEDGRTNLVEERTFEGRINVREEGPRTGSSLGQKKTSVEGIEIVRDDKKDSMEEPIQGEVKVKEEEEEEVKEVVKEEEEEVVVKTKSKQPSKESKMKRSKQATGVKEITIKEPELLTESGKKGEEGRVEDVTTPAESLGSDRVQLENAKEEPLKEEPSKEEQTRDVPVEMVEPSEFRRSENLPEEKTVQSNLESTVESNLESTMESNLESTTETPVAVDSTETPVAVDSTETPVAVDSTETPVAVDSTETPVAVDSTETPVAVDSTETPVAVDSTETPVAVDSTKTVLEEESKPIVELETETRPIEESEVIVEGTVGTESKELVSETDRPEGLTEEVKQDKKDAAKRAEEYLLKVEEESRTEEEKKEAVEIQITKYEMEEEKAWEALQIDLNRKAHLDEILEVEKAAAERKIEEERLEKERTEILRLEEAERQINAEKLRALMEEQERMLIEERAEEVRQRQEREERLAEVSLNINDDKKDADYTREDQLFSKITDQEMEEKAFDLPPTDDDTKIEEDNVVEYEVENVSMEPFVEEPDGESRPVHTGGTANVEDNFEWPDEEA